MYVEHAHVHAHVHVHAVGDGLYGMRVLGRWVRIWSS